METDQNVFGMLDILVKHVELTNNGRSSRQIEAARRCDKYATRNRESKYECKLR